MFLLELLLVSKSFQAKKNLRLSGCSFRKTFRKGNLRPEAKPPNICKPLRSLGSTSLQKPSQIYQKKTSQLIVSQKKHPQISRTSHSQLSVPLPQSAPGTRASWASPPRAAPADAAAPDRPRPSCTRPQGPATSRRSSAAAFGMRSSVLKEIFFDFLFGFFLVLSIVIPPPKKKRG